jgi:hypothetical protein
MQYRITKVYLVDAANRSEARRRIVSEGETHLKIISIQELKAPRAGAAADGQAFATLSGRSSRPAG